MTGKTIGVGFQKTGTSTLRDALELLGYSVKDVPPSITDYLPYAPDKVANKPHAAVQTFHIACIQLATRISQLPNLSFFSLNHVLRSQIQLRQV